MRWKHRCGWRGPASDLETTLNEKGKPVLQCPDCRLKTGFRLVRSAIAWVSTTYEKTAHNPRYEWVQWRPSKNIATHERDRVWAFCDGSTSGSFAAVLIEGDRKRELVRHGERTAIRNVSAELKAVALALNNVHDGADVTLVCDFLGTACWLSTQWRVKCAETMRYLRVIVKLIESKKLEVDFIHVKGHQKGGSDFVRYNDRADRLCAERPKDLP